MLRDVGSHVSINRMLTFESVKERLKREQSLSFLEFNYMILQSYDFLYLNKNEKCDLQIGGSDQWGNIVLGMEIISKINKKDAFGLTTPLLTTSTGKKMGKTEQGAVWIDENKYNSYDFYQYFFEYCRNLKFVSLYLYLMDLLLLWYLHPVALLLDDRA